MEIIGIIVVIAIFVLVLMYKNQKNKSEDRERDEYLKNSQRIDGQIIAVERQTQHERMRTKRPRIKVKVQFINPHTGSEEIALHFISRFTPDLPSELASAVGIVSSGSKSFSQLAARHKQMTEYKNELLAEGKSEAEVKDILMQTALRMSESTIGGLGENVDSEGFSVFPNPLNVDLYFGNGEPENKFIVVFRPAEEKDKFNSIERFK